MPSLGAAMEAGTLVEWLKHPGDVLHRGDIIAVVDTEKGAIEIEVFEDGVLEETRVPARREGARGHGPGHHPGAGVGAPPPAPQPLPGAAPPAVATAAVPPALPASGRRASPAARSLATERHVDLRVGGRDRAWRHHHPFGRRARRAGAPDRRVHGRPPPIQPRACVRPSARRWRGRSARSRISIWAPRST